MEPNPLYILMRNMTQRAHGPNPYDGILGATQEKVVAYEGEFAGNAAQAVTEAQEWAAKEYQAGSIGTLIEIRVVGTIDSQGNFYEDGFDRPQAKVESRRSDDCTCTSSRVCTECLL